MPTSPIPQAPPVLPGFEQIRRKWNDAYGTYAARILPGEFFVTDKDEGIFTTLGSCISACIRDRVSGVGGMNHFMLPTSGDAGTWKSTSLSAANRYGNFAMEHLINAILKNGGLRQNLEVKLFGGGIIMQNLSNVGLSNISFARDYLQTEKLKVVAEDVGDTYSRMVIFFPATGKVRVKRLRSLHNNIIVNEETRHINTVAGEQVGGEIELF